MLRLPGAPPGTPSPVVNFARVLPTQIKQITAACKGADGVVVSGPRTPPGTAARWEVVTPERVRWLTAAKPDHPTTQAGRESEGGGHHSPGTRRRRRAT
ncbi:hypothetical protein QJS66_16130 [Kocuria rhizophila]|nr:hypothetical protein QJS66_16130 [Kocuria rhizophila]